jgi:hypothetical protein
MTSSTVANSEGGTERPRALAALRFMTSLKRVGLLDRQIAGLCAFQDLVDIADRGALFPLGPDNRWTYRASPNSIMCWGVND